MGPTCHPFHRSPPWAPVLAIRRHSARATRTPPSTDSTPWPSDDLAHTSTALVGPTNHANCMTQPRAPTVATEHMPLPHPCSLPCLGREGKLAPAADLWSHPRIDSDRSSVLHPPDRPDALITVCRAQCSPATYKTTPRCPRVPINPTAAGGTPEHHTKNGRRVEETRRKEGEERRRRSRTEPRRSQERHPDQLQRRSCSAQHCIASSRPRLATTPPSYHHEPYDEP